MKRAGFLLVILSTIFLFGCENTPTSDDSINTTNYNSALGFSAQYPNNRTMRQNEYGGFIVFLSPLPSGDLFQENISIAVQNLSNNMSLNGYYDVSKIKESNEIITINDEKIKINGLPANKITYVLGQEPVIIKMEQVFLIKDSIVYTFTYTATPETFSDFSAIFDLIIKSFHIGDEKTNNMQNSTPCVIKGNISYKTQEKIYHVPGCASYDATVINTDYGERIFCSETEARAAGWRKAKNCP